MQTNYRRILRINILLWFVFFYIVGYVVVRQMNGLPPPLPYAVTLMVVAFLSMVARTWVALKNPNSIFSFTPWITFFDIFVIAIGVYTTGRSESALWLLYFPLLVSEMFTARSHQVVWMFSLTGLLNYLACLPLKNAEEFASIGTRLFFLFLAAWIVRSINKAHLIRERELAALREQIALAEERQRIAREFHDGLGHTLVNAVLGLEIARRCPDKKTILQGLEEQVQTLREALDEMRHVVWQLHPYNEQRSLSQKLHLFAKQINDRVGIKVATDIDDGDLQLPPTVEVMLARVVQESLNNIAKHASEATQVNISLKKYDHFVRITVSDNGVGFDLNKVIGGFGIQHMKERVEALKGEFTLESTPCKGTTISASIPINSSEDNHKEGTNVNG